MTGPREGGHGGGAPAPSPVVLNTTLSESLGPRSELSGGGVRGRSPRVYRQPKSIERCGEGAWSLRLLQKSERQAYRAHNRHGWPVTKEVWHGTVSDKEKWLRFRCGSWRHPGPCREWAARILFARIVAGLERHAEGHVCFLVLTLPRKNFRDPWEAFEAMCPMWRSWKKWLDRNFGSEGYVNTVEIHKSGFPHLNAILVSKQLSAALREPDSKAARGAMRRMKGAAVRCGWGPMLSAEVARDGRAVASYAVKVANHVQEDAAAASTVGEVVKGSQLPVNAPPRFRRVRSSPGFLEPRKKEGEWTGAMKFHPPPPGAIDPAELKKKKRRPLKGGRRSSSRPGSR